jgi:glycosyltransferase involved in cell wall biosynthesis
MIERVAYSLNGRLPSNNGYVIQIVRMCDGLQKAGYEPVLYHSARKVTDERLREADVFEFFGIQDRFGLISVPYMDFKRFHGRIDERILRPFILCSNIAYWVMTVFAMWWDDADLYVTRDWPIAYLLVRLGLPTVFEIHKTQKPSFSPRGQRLIGDVANRSALRQVVTLTEPTANRLGDVGIPREKIRIEPDGVDLTPYEKEVDKATARRELDLPEDRFLVVYTGSLQFEKGIPHLIDAVDGLDGVELVLVGGTDEERNAVGQYLTDNDIGGVRLLG